MMYRMEITYCDIDDFYSYSSCYVSEDKKELLKLFLDKKKKFDYVQYNIEELIKSPYHIYTTYDETY